ncbi:MAG: asparagine synthase (glutamine-hydrolyzing), partial [Steroidobacteraceae bacterium]
KELEGDGYVFTTGTDTEVIMAAYDRWGHECLSRFNGMWAFALYDRRTRRMLIARDRFGVKPLYWVRTSRLFVFASEIKALLEHPEILRRPNVDRCRAYLAMGPREYLQETLFEGVHRLPNASYVEATLDDLVGGRFTIRRFWNLVPNTSNEPFSPRACSEYAARYLELLTSAVELRLRADVRIGSTLSGGIDSSSVVWLANQTLKKRGSVDLQETFSSIYLSRDTKHCDESGYVDTLASNLNVRSHRIEPDVADVVSEHRKMIWHMDTPPESTLMSSWLTFKHIGHTRVKVVLEGQGADEQLAGYPRFLINVIAHSRQPWADFRALRRMPTASAFRALGLGAHMCERVGLGGLPVRALQILGKHVYLGGTLNEALVRDSLTGLQNLIHYADRTSMAFSVESRMPFLDYRVAEFLAALPAAYKVHDGWTKYLARVAFDGKLPARIAWRRDKMGWEIPEDVWFRGPLQGWAAEQVSKSRFLRELGPRSGIAAVLSGPGRGLYGPIRLLNLATWYDVHIEREREPLQSPAMPASDCAA